MNVKEYISSGIIESYVMGLVTEAERQEFESLCAQYPEIAAARNAFELALEAQLLADAKEPPQHLKKLVEEKLVNATPEPSADQLEEERTPVRRIGIWKWLAAASIILMAGAVYWAVTANNKNERLEAQYKELQDQYNLSTAQLNELREQTDIIRHPMMMASLKGTNEAPEAQATIFWDTAGKKDVYLLINNMPQPASDKQYQLWALLKGQPTNLGGIEITQKRLLYKLRNVQEAEAFAITLEPKGSDGPTPTTPPLAMSKL